MRPSGSSAEACSYHLTFRYIIESGSLHLPFRNYPVERGFEPLGRIPAAAIAGRFIPGKDGAPIQIISHIPRPGDEGI
jgi:hypothetical protein